MFGWLMNYFSDVEFIMFLWISLIVIFGATVGIISSLPGLISYICKTPHERAKDWVNAQIKKDNKVRRGE